jgi:hypothetical protein
MKSKGFFGTQTVVFLLLISSLLQSSFVHMTNLEQNNYISPAFQKLLEKSAPSVDSFSISLPVQNHITKCDKLYYASLAYLAYTPEDADKIARQIGYLGGKNESASLACGPLSITIMRDAGILPADISTNKIWLLCPREDREECNGIKILNQVYFPPDKFDYIRVYESVRTYNFSTNPLQPGDWLYLFTNIHGFDHMLVVTRVDEKGIAYTVTNLDRGKGFMITEEALYYPNNPEAGLFYELSDPQRGMLGMSGTGGFLLIRNRNGALQCSVGDRVSTLGLGK